MECCISDSRIYISLFTFKFIYSITFVYFNAFFARTSKRVLLPPLKVFYCIFFLCFTTQNLFVSLKTILVTLCKFRDALFLSTSSFIPSFYSCILWQRSFGFAVHISCKKFCHLVELIFFGTWRLTITALFLLLVFFLFIYLFIYRFIYFSMYILLLNFSPSCSPLNPRHLQHSNSSIYEYD